MIKIIYPVIRTTDGRVIKLESWVSQDILEKEIKLARQGRSSNFGIGFLKLPSKPDIHVNIDAISYIDYYTIGTTASRQFLQNYCQKNPRVETHQESEKII